jgi:phosphocarrier protein FPr
MVPITDVPDPTFSQKMVGDGIAIDPMSEVLKAPCGGLVSQLHSSRHALTVRTPDGIEVLMHIGLDTVLLKGEGFTAKVKEGDTVRKGDELIAFDSSVLAHKAKSLLTLMVVTNSEKVSEFKPSEGMAESPDTLVLDLVLKKDAEPEKAAAPKAEIETLESEPLVIPNPAGIHARPAAVLANNAKRFSSELTLSKEGKTANAKSVVAVMGLETKQHDRVILKAVGTDARAALEAIAPLIRAGLGDNVHEKPPEPAPAPVKAEKPRSGDPNLLLGVCASPGLATGPVFQLRQAEIETEEEGRGPEVERKALLDAIGGAKEELKTLQDTLRKRADTEKAAIFAAHGELLEDPELGVVAEDLIKEGKSAAFAWRTSYERQAEALSKLDNRLLAGRANDIRDIGRRVLSRIVGEKAVKASFPKGSVLVAEDLTPSDTAGLDKNEVGGFCTTGGSSTSHAAILARAMTIPAIAAIEERALEIPDGTPAILYGDKGRLRLNPPADEIARVTDALNKAGEARKKELSEAALPAVTTDGRGIKVVANSGSATDAEEVPGLGGEGVGLLRSEFLFLRRTDPPSEEEQAAVYAAIAKILGPDRDLVVRTLDVGGDKPLAYLPMPAELNPFLGVRGIRLTLANTELFRAQLRAILGAAGFSRLHVMFPMVSSADEFREGKRILEEEKEKLGVTAPVKVGMMVEVPSAAVLADALAKEADFFSVGTNDLTQYTLAMDRGHPQLAKKADAVHPAVLKLISETVKGARAHGRWAGVCGGVAGDIQALPVLVGLGVDELSVSAAVMPSVKAAVRREDYAECRKLAEKALGMSTAAEVRELLADHQDKK